MGALSFWYVWATGIRKKLINITFKKRKIFRGGSDWSIFSFIFEGLPTLSSIFSVISWSILKILVPILVQIFWILWNTHSFLNFDVLNEAMEERRKISNSENGPIWATPENLPFLKYEIYLLFSYSYGSKVPKWKCAHILLCKKSKNCLKLHTIADLQPPDWIQRKKTTLYVISNIFFNGLKE